MSEGRLACPQCGSNNFATQARCWSCGAALTRAPAAAAPSGTRSEVPAAARPSAAAPESYTPTAFWASVALGLIFPFVAVPVGIVFFMLDDRRRSQVGGWALLWGTIGTILHFLGTLWLSKIIYDQSLSVLTRVMQQRQQMQSESGSGLNLPGGQ